MALNASKELRAIMADIAAEAGGRGSIVEGAGIPEMDELSDAELEGLIRVLKEES